MRYDGVYVLVLSEWYWADQEATGYLLHEGCCVATEADGETDVYYKLHGDGPGDRCTIELPVNQRPTDKSGLAASKTGT